MFRVTLEVVDQSGNSISSIDATTNNPRNRVTVENICQLPKAVEVEVSLLNGQQRLEFMVAGQGQSDWRDTTSLIASKGKAMLECLVARNAGFAGQNEPIQFDQLSSRPAINTTFFPVNDTNVPFQITINVG